MAPAPSAGGGPRLDHRGAAPALVALVERSAPVAAPTMLGVRLVAELDGGRVVGEIVEVEAYTEDDPASHSHRGRTRRNASMFGAPGTLYVYLSHGIHHCANVVVAPEATGEAVLVRALRLVEGHDLVAARRCGRPERTWVDGPGKLCAALGIDRRHDGLDLLDPVSPIRLEPGRRVVEHEVVAGPRVGISRAVDRPWRWRVPLEVQRAWSQ